MNQNRNEPPVGFNTASGKHVSVSEQSLIAAKERFQDEDDRGNEVNNLNSDIYQKHNGPSLGFTTASGKKVSVSKEALAKAKKSLEEVDVESGKSLSKAGFITAGGKNITVSKESLNAAKERFQNEDDRGNEVNNLNSSSTDICQKHNGPSLGFTTASGKKVAISKEALDKAKKSLEMDTSAKVPLSENGPSLGFTTASGKKVAVSKEALDKAKKNLEMDTSTEIPLRGNGPSLGFTTASGKNVSVSKESLAMAKKKLEDDITTEMSLSENGLGPPLGFTTASGKKVAVSKESLAKAKKSLEVDMETEVSLSKNGPSVVGFTTASGKNVSVSKESLSAAKERIQDDLDNEVNSPDVTPPNLDQTVVNAEDMPEDDAMYMEVQECTRLLLDESKDEDNVENETSFESPDIEKSLSSVDSSGEIISKIKLAVIRVYPVIYCIDNGVSCPRDYLSKEAFIAWEQEHGRTNEKLREKLLPKLTMEVRESLAPPSYTPRQLSRLKNEDLEVMSGEELLKFALSFDETNGSEMCRALSLRKRNELEEERLKFNTRVQRTIEEKLLERLKSEGSRKRSSTVLKVRVMDIKPVYLEIDKVLNGMISIWNPNEEILSGLKEGAAFEFCDIKSNVSQSPDEVKFSSTKETRIVPLNDTVVDSIMQRQLTTIEQVLMTDPFNPQFGEFDTVGMVTDVDPPVNGSQTVHLSDQHENTMKIKFWKTLKDSGMDDVLKIGVVVACCNLQWRLTSSPPETAYVQETTTFNKNPKQDHLRNAYNELCCALKTNHEGSDQKERKSIGSDINKQSLIRSAPTLQQKRVSDCRLFSYSSKRLKTSSSSERSSESLPTTSTTDNTTPVTNRRRSKKFIPPRRIT